MNVLENPFGPLVDDPELIKKIENILSKKFEPVRSEEDEKALPDKVDGRSSTVQDYKSRVSSGSTRSNASSKVDGRSKAVRAYKNRVAKRNRRNGK